MATTRTKFWLMRYLDKTNDSTLVAFQLILIQTNAHSLFSPIFVVFSYQLLVAILLFRLFFYHNQYICQNHLTHIFVCMVKVYQKSISQAPPTHAAEAIVSTSTYFFSLTSSNQLISFRLSCILFHLCKRYASFKQYSACLISPSV